MFDKPLYRLYVSMQDGYWQESYQTRCTSGLTWDDIRARWDDCLRIAALYRPSRIEYKVVPV